MAESRLSSRLAESLLSTRVQSVEMPKPGPVCPRPRLASLPRSSLSSDSLEDAVVPRALSSRENSDLDASVEELRHILSQVDCTADSDPGPFLGVSPPVRSGACNPLAQDSAWKLKAQQASRTSLEALRRMDRSAPVHVPRCGAAAQCRGDYRLLFSPPECSLLGSGAPAHCDASSSFGPQQAVPARARHIVSAAWRGSSLSPDARIFG